MKSVGRDEKALRCKIKVKMKVTDVHCLVKASSKAQISALDTEFKYTVGLAPEDEGRAVSRADHVTPHCASEKLSVQKTLEMTQITSASLQ